MRADPPLRGPHPASLPLPLPLLSLPPPLAMLPERTIDDRGDACSTGINAYRRGAALDTPATRRGESFVRAMDSTAARRRVTRHVTIRKRARR